MMTCREVSTLVSYGELDAAPMRRRIGVWMHLAMCVHCRTFRRQLARIGDVARAAAAAFLREPPEKFERGIVDRLASS